MPFNLENRIESNLEQLQMDERLRSNLIDTEANLCLTWATSRLTNCLNELTDESMAADVLRAEMQRVKSTLRHINDLFDSDQSPSPEAALAVLGLIPKPDQAPQLPDRSALVQWLLDQVSAAWANDPTDG